MGSKLSNLKLRFKNFKQPGSNKWVVRALDSTGAIIWELLPMFPNEATSEEVADMFTHVYAQGYDDGWHRGFEVCQYGK